VCCNSDCGRGNGAFGSEPTSDCQACSVAAGSTGSDGTCSPARPGQQCRTIVGQGCDRVALCLFGSAICPPNPLMPASTICRAANGPCDNNEYCDGLTATCPPDSKLPSTTVCRPSVGPCDLAELCDGLTDLCPGDAKAKATTQCRPAAGPCDVAETCDGSTNNCPVDLVAPFGTVCHQAAGQCDMTESCDGNTKSCPFDYMQLDGTACTGGSCRSGLCRAEADLGIALTGTVTNTLPVTFTATVTNNGPSAALQILLQFALNNGVTLQTVPENCQASVGVVTCALTDLNSGSSTAIALQVLPPGNSQQFSVSSVVSSAIFDPLLANNSATAVAQGVLTPVLSGGGYGCSVTPHGGNQAAVAFLALALLGLLRRRRVSP
jgi:MYXO-CTERM domain-containing protein